MNVDLVLPDGPTLTGTGPVVIIGPNGSGKTRQSRLLQSNAPRDYVNALRNTRVAVELPAVGIDTARNNYENQKSQTQYNHWDMSGEFDYMLSQLLAQHSMVSNKFAQRYRADPANPGALEQTILSRVEELWSSIFEGRELSWDDWKPLITNRSTGSPTTYTGNSMSDGEKAALYLLGRALVAEPGIVVVDEPETHLHSLLAVKFWNAVEGSAPRCSVCVRDP